MLFPACSPVEDFKNCQWNKTPLLQTFWLTSILDISCILNLKLLIQHVEQVFPFLSAAVLDFLRLLAVWSSFFRLINSNLFSHSSLSLLPKLNLVFQLRPYQSWTNYALTKLKLRRYGRCFSPTNHLPTPTRKATDFNVSRKYESQFLVQKES